MMHNLNTGKKSSTTEYNINDLYHYLIIII